MTKPTYEQLEARLEMVGELAGVSEKLLEEAQKAYQAQAEELAAAGKTIEELAAENVGLKDALAAVVDRSNEPDYQSIGMGCGVEDNGLQTDGYNACEYGWREAMERIYSEVIPESLPETPATDAALAELAAETIKSALDKCCDYFDTDCVMESMGISYESASIRVSGALAINNALTEIANQLRGEASK